MHSALVVLASSLKFRRVTHVEFDSPNIEEVPSLP